MSHVPPTGTRGGLLLAWRHGVELECFLFNVNIISAWCYFDPSNTPWIPTCVYDPPSSKNKSNFWDSISDIGENFNGAWLCIGDFNMILDQSKKKGGHPFTCSSNDTFRSFHNKNGMVDLGFSSNPFTWSNKREGNRLIKERLDCGMASTQWIHLFPAFSLRHFPAYASDHNPILLNTTASNTSLLRPFILRNFGLRTPPIRRLFLMHGIFIVLALKAWRSMCIP